METGKTDTTTTAPKPSDVAKVPKIKVLMVDDQAMVCEAVRRMLVDEADIEFHCLTEPTKAIETALEIKPTVILQDLVMPDVDGLTLVKFFRAKPELKEVPMIVLSSKEEPETKKKAFELGANDYMVKLPDKLEVLARIRYHSKGYINLLQRNAAQAALQAELDEAARYVKALFPDRIDDSAVSTDWVFISSTDLAGDSFGYYWLDDDTFVIYLLDVCGHGVGAALHSVSALNVLRSQSLPGVDFKDPGAVLSALNEAFDMDKHNQMYFTMWYGVYDKNTRSLKYASGGHPPSVLVPAIEKPNGELTTLATPGMVVGGMQGVPFPSDEITVGAGDLLYVFSDGVYEVDYKDGSGMMTEEEFSRQLHAAPDAGKSKMDSMVDWVREAQGRDAFEDDFSLMEVKFK
ncbi:fused response regulator/phosphatase [Rubellicoccus peritrichatus]|uniref:Fused response regulator/phosphatase n=1 Tax=Rubellicoccus peritrichatus TaxID=3080537 RepID=A0AAQ3LD99_9BACT|nr:fused response regulator/phosphatase [Puniceicoccus sp. CR14]WOO43257.1 fused response regulator/phosphatase [Puniceicoccus sp. CR14]